MVTPRSRKLALLISLLVSVAALVSWAVWREAVAPGPLIGVSSDTAWHSRLGLSSATYQTALSLANARPVEFRPGDATVDELLDRFDGLVIAGGGDVDPARYGGRPHDADDPDRARDRLETELVQEALARDMPVLGICRGLQILNVAHGGSLRNLRRDAVLGPNHGGRLEWQHLHDVHLTPGSRLAAIEKSDRKRVNSFHGQALARIGPGLHVAAQAPDGVIEAVERRDRRFVIGVQWHPEILALVDPDEKRLLEALVKTARQYAAEKRH